jgi:hypothetical protein
MHLLIQHIQKRLANAVGYWTLYCTRPYCVWLPGEVKAGPERKNLCSYIQSWIQYLQTPEGVQLYQDN